MNEETRTMQTADTTTARAPEDAPALVKKIGKTTYKVRVHFSDTSTETMTDVAYYYIDELQALGDIPPSLQNYIDYEAYGRDLDMGGCFIETSRGMCEIPY